jgi:hypothetical protein
MVGHAGADQTESGRIDFLFGQTNDRFRGSGATVSPMEHFVEKPMFLGFFSSSFYTGANTPRPPAPPHRRVMMWGVKKITSSVLSDGLAPVPEGHPKRGILPKIGTWESVLVRWSSISPPITTVTPSLTKILVSASEVRTMGMELPFSVVITNPPNSLRA